MVDAELDVLATLLFFFDKACRQAPAPRVDHCATFLSFDRRMETQVFPTGQTQSAKFFLIPKLL